MNMARIRRGRLTPKRCARSEALESADVRALSLASGAGRIAIGVGLALAPRQALAALGFEDASPSTVAISRVAGGRDIVLGGLTLLARGDAERLATASVANAAVDAGDALTFTAALGAGEEIRAAALRGIAAAVPAAAAGIWVALRLRRDPGR
jgi:hypothetical protein